jgi:transposase
MKSVVTFRVLKAHWKEAHMDKYIVKLTPEERAELLLLIRVGKKAANKLMHARVLLSADENDTKLKPKTDKEIATEIHVSSKTVARIRQRFVEEGMESALSRRPHANPKSRKIDGEQEAYLVALCCSTPPEGRSRWTLKLLANKLVSLELIDTVSPSTICRVLKKTK